MFELGDARVGIKRHPRHAERFGVVADFAYGANAELQFCGFNGIGVFTAFEAGENRFR